jgi:hypothetical protein
VISTRNVIFDRSKRYDPNDDPSYATEEVIETIRCLTLDVDADLKDWEALPPAQLQSYKRSIDKHGDTIVVNMPEGSLPTPETTPEPNAAQAPAAQALVKQTPVAQALNVQANTKIDSSGVRPSVAQKPKIPRMLRELTNGCDGAGEETTDDDCSS